ARLRLGVFLLLIFYLYRVPRYLASFPARRSSDLDTQPEGQRNPLQDQVDRLVGEGCREAAPGECAIGVVKSDLVVVPPSERAHGDRKSTRLNSSHVAISYAVFCLKKKSNHKLHLM